MNWIVRELKIQLGESDGTGDCESSATVNPSGGTLISGGTEFEPVNLNLGNSKELAVLAIYGAEGSTVSGGDTLTPGLIVDDKRDQIFSGGPIVISTGVSLALSIKPPAGNTSMNIQFDLTIYRDLES